MSLAIHDTAIVGRTFVPNSRDPSAYRRAFEEGQSAQVFTKLWSHFPGYDWHVSVDSVGGLCKIKLPLLMQRRSLWWNCHLADLDPALSLIVKGGGELLERFKLRRARANTVEYREVANRKPLSFLAANDNHPRAANDNLPRPVLSWSDKMPA